MSVLSNKQRMLKHCQDLKDVAKVFASRRRLLHLFNSCSNYKINEMTQIEKELLEFCDNHKYISFTATPQGGERKTSPIDDTALLSSLLLNKNEDTEENTKKICEELSHCKYFIFDKFYLPKNMSLDDVLRLADNIEAAPKNKVSMMEFVLFNVSVWEEFTYEDVKANQEWFLKYNMFREEEDKNSLIEMVHSHSNNTLRKLMEFDNNYIMSLNKVRDRFMTEEYSKMYIDYEDEIPFILFRGDCKKGPIRETEYNLSYRILPPFHHAIKKKEIPNKLIAEFLAKPFNLLLHPSIKEYEKFDFKFLDYINTAMCVDPIILKQMITLDLNIPTVSLSTEYDNIVSGNIIPDLKTFITQMNSIGYTVRKFYDLFKQSYDSEIDAIPRGLLKKHLDNIVIDTTRLTPEKLLWDSLYSLLRIPVLIKSADEFCKFLANIIVLLPICLANHTKKFDSTKSVRCEPSQVDTSLYVNKDIPITFNEVTTSYTHYVKFSELYPNVEFISDIRYKFLKSGEEEEEVNRKTLYERYNTVYVVVPPQSKE